LALLSNYNQLWQLTINECLRFAPFLTGRVSLFHCTESRTRNPFRLSWMKNDDSPTNELELCSHSILTLLFLLFSLLYWAFSRVLPFITSREPNRDHHLQHLVVILSLTREWIFVNIRCRGKVCQSVATLWLLPAYPLQRESVFTEPLLKSGRPLWLHYSGFQPVLTEPLSSNGHIRHCYRYCYRFNLYIWHILCILLPSVTTQYPLQKLQITKIKSDVGLVE
jgi:hypothetical protein